MISQTFYKQNNEKENEHNKDVEISSRKKKSTVNQNGMNNLSKWKI